MIIGSCRIWLRADWVNSLKEKRTVVKGITDKVKNKFNVSIAEVENQDMHKEIGLGFACVTNESRHAQSVMQNVVAFVEGNTDAEVVEVQTEVLY